MRAILRRGFLALAILLAQVVPAHLQAQSYNCGLKHYCPEMKDCAEADFNVKQCGLTRLDGDNDGIPCEEFCGNTYDIYQKRLEAQTAPNKPSFRCAGKNKCNDMVSCDEAKFNMDECGVSRLDGNNDGIPCNSICR